MGYGHHAPEFTHRTLLLGLFILGIVAEIQWPLGRRTQGTQTSEESARNILKKRYARGELTKPAPSRQFRSRLKNEVSPVRLRCAD